ncbi:L10-interacting MYB domain-containing protein [Cinnamomum micranthum f. kanehirae]|uniref:L10-interacting MYB domain-containing protein n=1 Tax=Cinnamomum micranthum f. kanehirae TaxID=337451 RepID=A0A443NBS9_9MAGN|nr:L10-interacting MYB domain-containing protein [Cinnamomum micranthum f. kanehirae]
MKLRRVRTMIEDQELIRSDQYIDPTPSSSRKSKKEAKGVGAKMANQIDHLIEVVATRQLGDEESARSTPTIIDCIKRLDAMDQVDSGSELYFYAVDLFSKKNYKMTFMGFEKLMCALNGYSRCTRWNIR